MIALSLSLALALVAKPSAAPARPAPAPQPAPAEAASAPGAEQPLDPDVVAFLSIGRGSAARDGGVKLPWDGPGAAQLRLSWDALDRRNEQLSVGDMMARSLVDVVQKFYDSDGGVEPAAMKAKLKSMVGGSLDEARTAYLDAVTWEERRLFFVEKAVSEAQAAAVAIPGVLPELVRARAAAIRSGRVKAAVAAQMDGYGDLVKGLIAYLDGDNFGALDRVGRAARALPDFAVAHAFLGSLYFLFDQREAAVRSWRRAYELDPGNRAVAEALKEHGRPKRQPKTTRPAGKDDR